MTSHISVAENISRFKNIYDLEPLGSEELLQTEDPQQVPGRENLNMKYHMLPL